MRKGWLRRFEARGPPLRVLLSVTVILLASTPFALAWLNPVPSGSPPTNGAPTITRTERLHYIVRFAVSPEAIRYGQAVQISYYVAVAEFGYTPIFDGIGLVEISTDKENWSEIFTLDSMPLNRERTNFTRPWGPQLAGQYYVRLTMHYPAYYIKVLTVKVDLAPTILQLQAPQPNIFGNQIEVKGRLLTFDGKPLNDASVRLIYTSPRGVSITKQVKTDPAGSFTDSFEAPNAANWTVSAEYGGDPLRYEKSSASASFLVDPATTLLSLSSHPASIIEGQSVELSGSLKTQRDSPVAGLIRLVLASPDGTKLEKTLTTDANGGFLLIQIVEQIGVWHAKAFFSGTPDYAASESLEITFSVVAKSPPPNPLVQPLILVGSLLAAFAVGVLAFAMIRRQRLSGKPEDQSPAE